jgi:hypothetical protein
MILYTGVGAKPSGKHSVPEFLEIMRHHFGVQCSHFLADEEYDPCVQKKMMNDDFFKKYSKNKSYRRSKSLEQKYLALSKKCQKYKDTRKQRKCDVNEFIRFSGAEHLG